MRTLFVAGILVGAALGSAGTAALFLSGKLPTRATHAEAPAPRYSVGTVDGSTVWRLDIASGQLEFCGAANAKVMCVKMPAPSEAITLSQPNVASNQPQKFSYSDAFDCLYGKTPAASCPKELRPK